MNNRKRPENEVTASLIEITDQLILGHHSPTRAQLLMSVGALEDAQAINAAHAELLRSKILKGEGLPPATARTKVKAAVPLKS